MLSVKGDHLKENSGWCYWHCIQERCILCLQRLKALFSVIPVVHEHHNVWIIRTAFHLGLPTWRRTCKLFENFT